MTLCFKAKKERIRIIMGKSNIKQRRKKLKKKHVVSKGSNDPDQERVKRL